MRQTVALLKQRPEFSPRLRWRRINKDESRFRERTSSQGPTARRLTHHRLEASRPANKLASKMIGASTLFGDVDLAPALRRDRAYDGFALIRRNERLTVVAAFAAMRVVLVCDVRLRLLGLRKGAARRGDHRSASRGGGDALQ